VHDGRRSHSRYCVNWGHFVIRNAADKGGLIIVYCGDGQDVVEKVFNSIISKSGGAKASELQ
jgi:hypothetical protein